MAQINFNADFKIKVVYPYLTRSLTKDDKTRIGATGSFRYTPKPQVDSAQSANTTANYKEPASTKERAAKLQDGLLDLLKQIEQISQSMSKRAKGVVFKYDPALAENEEYTDAEETLFGFASGVITFDMYKQILDFEEKIDRWIGHQSIENNGKINGVA